MSRIEDFLKTEPEVETVGVTVRVSKELHEKVKKLLARKGIGWANFITACMEVYLQETEKNGKH